ncbi:hypothetical protein C8R42DRAFT_718257 [Lentinula raphanica]|nr:hypothetical protein C8R42DRAFT_718257 [Lentinula raphanica]
MDPSTQIDFKQHAKLEAEYQTCFARWSKLQSTLDRWDLPQNRLRLDDSRKTKLQSLKAKLEEAQKQLDAAHARRAEYGNSSLASLLNSVEQQETRKHDFHKLASELNQKLVEAATLQKETEIKVPAPPIASNDVELETVPGSSKRRRISDGYEDTASALATQTKEEISGLHAILQAISERVSTVENDIVAQDAEVREVMREYNDKKEGGEPTPTAVDSLEVRVSHVQNQMVDIATNLKELSEWIAGLYQSSDAMLEKHESIMARKEEEENEIRKLLRRIEAHEKLRAEDKNEIEALSAALTAYAEKPVSPPSSPFDPENMVLDMEEQIRELVRSAVKPHVEEARAALSEDLQGYDAELYQSIWSKLSLTHKVIAAVSEATSRPPS